MLKPRYLKGYLKEVNKMKIGLTIFVVILVLSALTGCCFSSGSSTTTATKATNNLPDSVEYKMATIDNGFIDKEDPIINNYKILLDSLEKKTINSRIDISDITVTAQRLLKERGINKSLLSILEDFDNSIPDGLEQMKLEEIASAYMVLMTE